MSVPLLTIDRARKAFGGLVAVNDVSFEVAKGELLGLIGPNGSGKTTLMRCLAGVLEPTAGRIAIDGIALAQDKLAAKQRLGYAVDPVLLPDALTGDQCLKLFAEVRGLSAVPPDMFELAEALAFAPWLHEPVERYSLGTRQKLGILLGLIGTPPLLVLDEPMNGLDPVSAYELKQYLVRLVRAGRVGVLLATHALEVAERFITRAELLVEGRLTRAWNSEQLAAIRADPSHSLEQAMVEELRRKPA